MVPEGCVTIPVILPPDIKMFPFTSMFPVTMVDDPDSKMLPLALVEFAAVILPTIVLLFESWTLPPLYRLVLNEAPPVVLIKEKLPIEPPLIVMPGDRLTPEPPNIAKSVAVSVWPNEFVAPIHIISKQAKT